MLHGKSKCREAAWRHWASVQAGILGTTHWGGVELDGQCRIHSWFSGTGADVEAAKLLLGAHRVQCSACDICKPAADWFIEAHKPEHFWREDAHRALANLAASGDCCGSQCTAHRQGSPRCDFLRQDDCDIFTAGYPCVFNTVLRTDRWKIDPNKRPKAVESIIAISSYLARTPKPPRMVVLENSAGILLRGRFRHAPLGFVMYGVHGGRRVGLMYNERYRFAWTRTDSLFWLPQSRARVYIYGVLRSLDPQGDLMKIIRQRLKNLHESQRAVPHDSQMWRDCVAADEVAWQAPCSKWRHAPLTQKACVQSRAFRLKHNLPKRTRDKGPFSLAASADFLLRFCKREEEVLNCAMHRAKQLNNGEVPASLLVEVSQSLQRSAWTWTGKARALTCNSRLVAPVAGMEFGPASCFQLQGWEAQRLPKGALQSLTLRQLRRLCGNMMAVPCIGSVLHCLLATVPLHCGDQLVVPFCPQTEGDLCAERA